MSKQKCPVCTNTKGRRSCLINKGELICSKCCANLRTLEQCDGCSHYHDAEKHNFEKMRLNGFVNLYSDKDKEIDKLVDQVLETLDKGYTDQASARINGLLEKYPESHHTHYAKGCLCLTNSDPESAISHFKKSLEIFPYTAIAWNNLTYCYQETYEIEKYVRCALNTIKYGDPKVYFVQAQLEAIADFKKNLPEGETIEQFLKTAEIYDTAFAYLEDHQVEDARDNFLKVLENNPKHVQSHGNLGLCYGILGEKERALEYFDKALELDPNYEIATLNRAQVAALKDGKKLPNHGKSINYYKDKVKSNLH